MKCSASLTLAPSPFCSVYIWLDFKAVCGCVALLLLLWTGMCLIKEVSNALEMVVFCERILWVHFSILILMGYGNVRAAMFCFIAIWGKKIYEKLVQEFLFYMIFFLWMLTVEFKEHLMDKRQLQSWQLSLILSDMRMWMCNSNKCLLYCERLFLCVVTWMTCRLSAWYLALCVTF